MSTKRPSWVPASISEQSASAFVKATLAAKKAGEKTMTFEGKKYAVSSKLVESTFKDGYRYVIAGPAYFNFRYNDSGASDSSEWLEFIRDNINSDIPDSCSVITWDKRIDPNDSDDKEVEKLITQLEEYGNEKNYGGLMVVPHGGFNDEEEISEIVEKINKLTGGKSKVTSGDDADLSDFVSESYFGGGTRDIEEAVRAFRPGDISDFDTSDYEKHFDELKSDFNSANMAQHFPKELGITSMKMEDLSSNHSGAVYTIVVETSKKLTKEETESLISKISGQMSDGWGEGAEQIEVKSAPEVANGFIDITISFWKANKKGPRVIATETIDSDVKASAKKYVEKAKKLFKDIKRAVGKKLSENTQDHALDATENNLLFSKLKGFGALEPQELRKLLLALRHNKENPTYIVNSPTLRVFAVTLLIDLLDELASDRISLQRVAAKSVATNAEVAAAIAKQYMLRADAKEYADGSDTEDVTDYIMKAAKKFGITQTEFDDALTAIDGQSASKIDKIAKTVIDSKFSDAMNIAVQDYHGKK